MDPKLLLKNRKMISVTDLEDTIVSLYKSMKSGFAIRDKLESIEKEEDKLDISAIKGGKKIQELMTKSAYAHNPVPVMMLVNGVRSKNIQITGGTVTYNADTAFVELTSEAPAEVEILEGAID